MVYDNWSREVLAPSLYVRTSDF